MGVEHLTGQNQYIDIPLTVPLLDLGTHCNSLIGQN